MRDLDFNLRELFNLEESEDITQHMVMVREDLEMKALVERELEKLQAQLKGAQQREVKLIEAQTSKP